jgi:hypothetical protein
LGSVGNEGKLCSGQLRGQARTPPALQDIIAEIKSGDPKREFNTNHEEPDALAAIFRSFVASVFFTPSGGLRGGELSNSSALVLAPVLTALLRGDSAPLGRSALAPPWFALITSVVPEAATRGGAGYSGTSLTMESETRSKWTRRAFFTAMWRGTEDQLGALDVDSVAGEGVDDFHERGLNGFFALDESDGMEARLHRRADAAHHALMEVAELLSAESGGAAADSGNLDMGTELYVWHVRFRTSDLRKNVYLGAKIFTSLKMRELDLLESRQNIGKSGLVSKMLRILDLTSAAMD